jgi:hypothetical protein
MLNSLEYAVARCVVVEKGLPMDEQFHFQTRLHPSLLVGLEDQRPRNNPAPALTRKRRYLGSSSRHLVGDYGGSTYLTLVL